MATFGASVTADATFSERVTHEGVGVVFVPYTVGAVPETPKEGRR